MGGGGTWRSFGEGGGHRLDKRGCELVRGVRPPRLIISSLQL